MPIGSIIGGMIGAGGASAAGAGAAQAGNTAFGHAQDQKKFIQEIMSPYYQTGVGAENELAGLSGLGSLSPSGQGGQNLSQSDRAGARDTALANFYKSPGYNFRLQEGTNALDRSASSRGMVLSGAQQRAVSDYGQNTGSQEFGNYTGQLNALAGGGQRAADTIVGGTNQALLPSIQSQFQGNMAQANGYQNSANALASGISSGINSLASLGAGYMGGLGSGGGQQGGYTLAGAPSGGYGGYAGYANTLPGFSNQ